MRTRTLKIDGKFTDQTDQTLSYPLGVIEAINSGRWELAISSIAVIISKNLAWNCIYEVSTNYIDNVVIGTTGSREREPMTLSFFRLKGVPNDKLVVGFKWRDFFQITNPCKELILNFKQHVDPDMAPEPQPAPGQERCAHITVLLILRRVE